MESEGISVGVTVHRSIGLYEQKRRRGLHPALSSCFPTPPFSALRIAMSSPQNFEEIADSCCSKDLHGVQQVLV